MSCFQNSDRLLLESKNSDFNLETQSVKHFYLKPCHAVQFFLQSNSTLSACKIGKYMFPIHGQYIFNISNISHYNLHLLKVEFRCKLQEKLHRVTGPFTVVYIFGFAFRLGSRSSRSQLLQSCLNEILPPCQLSLWEETGVPGEPTIFGKALTNYFDISVMSSKRGSNPQCLPSERLLPGRLFVILPVRFSNLSSPVLKSKL